MFGRSKTKSKKSGNLENSRPSLVAEPNVRVKSASTPIRDVSLPTSEVLSRETSIPVDSAIFELLNFRPIAREVHFEDNTPRKLDNKDEKHKNVHSTNNLGRDAHESDITMRYLPTKKILNDQTDEIIVVQSHSNNRNKIVFRGHVNCGATFSFRSRRQAESKLSLKFYVNKRIHSTIEHCCDFNYSKQGGEKTNRSGFVCQKVNNANPCAKCSQGLDEKETVENIEKVSLVAETTGDEMSGIDTTLSKSVTIDLDELEEKSSVGSAFETFLSNFKSADRWTEGNHLSSIKRRSNSVENFAFILDKRIEINEEDFRRFQSLINFGLNFDGENFDQCRKFLDETQHEQIIFILSTNSMKIFEDFFSNYSKICFIYLIDPFGEKRNEKENPIRIYKKFPEILEDLSDGIRQTNFELNNVSFVGPNSNENESFHYVQALREILIENENHLDAKNDLLEFCRENYRGNKFQLKWIKTFEKNFNYEQSIQWFLDQEKFYFKMLSRSLRIFDPDILLKIRFFLQSLNLKLKDSTHKKNFLIVYRTLDLSKNILQQLEKAKGGLFSFNQMILVEKTSKIFNEGNVVFKIEFQGQFSIFNIENQENEFIIPFGEIFRIENVDSSKERIFVSLKFDEKIREKSEILRKKLGEKFEAPTVSLRLAKLMKDFNFSEQLEYFCLISVDDRLSKENSTSNLINGEFLSFLGVIFFRKNELDRSLSLFEKSIEVYRRVLDENDVKLSSVYNNIAGVLKEKGQMEKSFDLFKKALQIQENSSNPDLHLIIGYLGNISLVLMKMSRFEEAIFYLEENLKIHQIIYGNVQSEQLSNKFHNLGLAFFRTKQIRRSIECYRKSLEIDKEICNENDSTIALTLFHLATALEVDGQIEQAKSNLKNSIERLRRTKSEDDPQLKTHLEFFARLQSRI